MGIFSKRTAAPAVPATGWQPDGSGVTTGGPAADSQLGAAYRVHFVNPAAPGCLITLTYFAEEAGRRYAVGRECEFLVCSDPSDPHGTKVWSDTDYDGVAGMLGPFSSATYAERAALENAEWSLECGEDIGAWAPEGFAGWFAAGWEGA